MDFYLILQEIMDEKGINIPTVARLCNLSDGTVRSILVRKQKNVALEVAFKLSKGLNVSLERLNGLPEKTKKSTGTAEPGPGKVDAAKVESLLVELGFVRPGQDLSDADLQFLLSVGEIVRIWFDKSE